MPGDTSSSPDSAAGLRPADGIAGLQKGLRLLESFNGALTHMTVTQAARAADLSRTSARRFLLTLKDAGYLDSDGKRYWLTARALRIGDAYMQSARLPKLVQPVVERLGYLAQESATMGVLDGLDLIYIARSSTSRIMSPTLKPGSRVPLYCTAGGRVLLASMTTSAARAALQAAPMRPLTPYTRLDADEILGLLPAVAQQGHALVEREFEANMRSLSVPACNRTGETVGVLSMSTDAQRTTVEGFKAQALPLLFEAQGLLRDLL
ncbi:MAG: IclR family transcriptional regulator C-terminal domain-containing protein [Pseudomonadota bacterium]